MRFHRGLQRPSLQPIEVWIFAGPAVSSRLEAHWRISCVARCHKPFSPPLHFSLAGSSAGSRSAGRNMAFNCGIQDFQSPGARRPAAVAPAQHRVQLRCIVRLAPPVPADQPKPFGFRECARAEWKGCLGKCIQPASRSAAGPPRTNPAGSWPFQPGPLKSSRNQGKAISSGRAGFE